MLKKAWEALEKTPLCDRCLGRLFARLGVGLDNKLRGQALKLLITLEVHEELRRGGKPEEYVKLASHANYPPLTILLEKYGVKVETVECRVCSGRLDSLIEEFAEKTVEELERLDVKTFVVGVSTTPELEEREEELLQTLKLETYESIKRELKREVGKRVAERTGLKPEFQNPDVITHLFIEGERVEVKPAPLYIMGRYWKLGRNISQATWLTRNGKNKKYKLSVEEALKTILEIYSGEELKIHAAGREDVDARMLGSGRPVIVEVKKPKHRTLRVGEVYNAVKEYSRGRVVFKPEKITVPRRVRELKEKSKTQKKTYRALVLLEKPVPREVLLKALGQLKEKTVEQKTPLRVLRRRSERVRKKKVYDLNVKIVEENLVELLLECEGGLYVKELINGDSGRTRPSLAQLLECRAECIELDVLGVD